MNLTIGVAVYGQLAQTKAAWGSILGTMADAKGADLVVVDNGSQDHYAGWLNQYMAPRVKQFTLLSNPENVGVFASYNQICRAARTEVIALLHNDLYLYEHGWDARVLAAFKRESSLGVAGFGGARGIASNGGRYEFWSNMLEAEIHGNRGWGEIWVSMLDGFSLICRRSMLEKCGGFDEYYPYHHYYDMDICMKSIHAGYKNMLIGVRCHHDSGKTASSPQYLDWVAKKMDKSRGDGDQAAHSKGQARFMAKWRHLLPVYY